MNTLTHSEGKFEYPYRPNEISPNLNLLEPLVGLYGTCGSPESTWRHDIVIPMLSKKGLTYFNPQLGPGQWSPVKAKIEAEYLAKSEVIIFPISKETTGYASLGEAGWAVIGCLLRGQKMGLYVEEDKEMSQSAIRTRILFKRLLEKLMYKYPVFQFENNIEDLAQWAAFALGERIRLRGSNISESRTIKILPEGNNVNCVGIYGTSDNTSDNWRTYFESSFIKSNVNFYNPRKNDWSILDINTELNHKITNSVILQYISPESESLGSIAESGLLALSAFLRGQHYGICIEEHNSSPKSDTNRARILVKEHINRLNQQFPGIIYVADSKEELLEWSIIAYKLGNASNTSLRVKDILSG